VSAYGSAHILIGKMAAGPSSAARDPFPSGIYTPAAAQSVLRVIFTERRGRGVVDLSCRGGFYLIDKRK
jgi:hypothetical protein